MSHYRSRSSVPSTSTNAPTTHAATRLFSAPCPASVPPTPFSSSSSLTASSPVPMAAASRTCLSALCFPSVRRLSPSSVPASSAPPRSPPAPRSPSVPSTRPSAVPRASVPRTACSAGLSLAVRTASRTCAVTGAARATPSYVRLCSARRAG